MCVDCLLASGDNKQSTDDIDEDDDGVPGTS